MKSVTVYKMYTIKEGMTYIPEDSKHRKLELSNLSKSLTNALSELRTLSRTCELYKYFNENQTLKDKEISF